MLVFPMHISTIIDAENEIIIFWWINASPAMERVMIGLIVFVEHDGGKRDFVDVWLVQPTTA